MTFLVPLLISTSLYVFLPARPNRRALRKPNRQIQELVEKRQRRKIRTATPLEVSSFIDRFALCMSAGLGVSESLDRSSSVGPDSLQHDIESVVTAMRLGQTVDGALLSLAESQPQLSAFADIVSRSHRSGAPLAESVDSLNDFTRQAITSDATRRIRSVGVKAVLPLGLCFLPAFVLLAIVPVIVGLVKNIG